MEIGPINEIRGIRMIPAVKAPSADNQLPAVFDIAYTARAGDETYSGSGRSAGGQDGDEDEAMEGAESGAEADEDGPAGSISLFA